MVSYEPVLEFVRSIIISIITPSVWLLSLLGSRPFPSLPVEVDETLTQQEIGSLS